ncbi:MAG: DUF4062 domain-containing protein [Anaerolineales bacterium]
MTEKIKKYYQVFVSSTYVDLQEERREIIHTLLKVDCFPVGMELFPSNNDGTWELIQKMIDQCDLYIVIVGGRYGSSPKNDKRSYTEMEYDYAMKKGVPVRVYIKKDIKFDKTENAVKQDRLKKFISRIQDGRLVNFWSSPSELKEKLAVDLYHTLPELEGGWARQKYGAIDFLSEEIQLLQNKFNSEDVKSLTNLLRSTLREFQFTQSRDRISQLGEIIPWLSEKEWKILGDFARAQVMVRSNEESIDVNGRRVSEPMRSSIVDLVNHYEKQLRDFEKGTLIVEGDLFDKVSGHFVSAVKRDFLALSNNDFDFWGEETATEYYNHNLKLIKNGVSIKRIFVVPKSNFGDKIIHKKILQQIENKIQVSIISTESLGKLITDEWDKDFAIHDNFAVSFFRGKHRRIYKVITDEGDVERYKELYQRIANNCLTVPEKTGEYDKVFQDKKEFVNWAKMQKKFS